MKTLEEHREYLHGMVRLKAFFLWRWLRRHPGEGFRAALRKRVDIYRKTDANPGGWNPTGVRFDGAAWLVLEDAAEACWDRWREADSAVGFEREMAEIFRESVDARVGRDFAERPSWVNFRCGSLNFDPPSVDAPERVLFHAANSVAPRSLFADPAHLRECFRRLLAELREVPGVRTIWTETWLNSHPAWLAQLPPEWGERMSGPVDDVAWHYGFWGQFINARGTLNERVAARFRETGYFPYPFRRSECSLDELEAFLAEV